MTPMPEPESASEVGHKEGEEKIFREYIQYKNLLVYIAGSAMTHACCLIFFSPLSIFFSLKRDGDVYLIHESGLEQLWERLSDLLL